MRKFIIIDSTSNTGKDYIDENGDNCTKENAELFDSHQEAWEKVMSIQSDTSWAYIAETGKES